MAFFSDTDESTLREGGNETNCWLMLIVDTRGQYVARITRKVKAKKEITTKDLGSSYEFFGEGEVKLGKGNTTKQSVEEDVIEYYDLNVERHEVHNPLASLDERFDEIEAKKNPPVPSNPFNTPVTQGFQSFLNKEQKAKDNFYDLSHPWEARKQKVNEPWLFDQKTMDSITDEDAVFANWQPDKNLIHAAVCKMISCSLILNVERFDMRQWITRHMNNVYERIFPETDKQDLQEWLEFAVDFFVYHFVDPSAPQGIGDEWYFGQIANAMIEELTPYDDVKYPYIKPYIDQLSTIIV